MVVVVVGAVHRLTPKEGRRKWSPGDIRLVMGPKAQEVPGTWALYYKLSIDQC